MKDATPQEEVEDLVDGMVEEKRAKIREENEELIEKTVNQLKDKPFRDMNVVFSEVRRRLEEVKN